MGFLFEFEGDSNQFGHKKTPDVNQVFFYDFRQIRKVLLLLAVFFLPYIPATHHHR